MNRIEAITAKSKHATEAHPIVSVDGTPLGELLEAALPENGFEGLVSSLLGWFYDEKDSLIPGKRILPDVGCTAYAPILICPDDLDLSCSVVIAEVVAEQNAIRWERLGMDASRRGAVGSCVRWLPAVGPYRFSREDYERCLTTFRRYAGIDS